MQQLVDGEEAAGADADPGAFGVGVLLGAGTTLFESSSLSAAIAVSTLMMLAGRVPAVRVFGGDHRAAVQVGHQPGLG